MGLRDVLSAASAFDPHQFTSLSVEAEAVGWVGPELAAQLPRWPGAFACRPEGIALVPATPEARSDALAAVVRALADEGLIRGWRNERYTIFSPATGAPLFALERAAMRAFGLTARAAHLNAYVREASGWRMWIAQRSNTKPIDPGMLDNLVGGGIAEGMDAASTLIKECAEEAGISPVLAAQARAAGTLRVTCSVLDGIQDEIIHAFDLELPADFMPANHDGEVARFHLVTRAELTERIEAGRFTVDAALVAIDFIARSGALPSDPALEQLLAARRVQA